MAPESGGNRLSSPESPESLSDDPESPESPLESEGVEPESEVALLPESLEPESLDPESLLPLLPSSPSITLDPIPPAPQPLSKTSARTTRESARKSAKILGAAPPLLEFDITDIMRLKD